ncbi:multiple sugar-binding protein [Demequina sediminis]|uniref:Multiple sugar-binding protein n=1 Tax=Demequina sediminis TaxID=1930058 RepID=A0ABP9WEJ4_9MICO|nr:extracellular solute-binding protein [Demequina sediminis]BDZ62680.1 sugar ABC transporter substrate-binding protein [Demequina sediminis]
MANMRRVTAGVAIAASMALLAACSSNEEPEGGATSGATGGAAEPVTLTWWHNGVAGDSGENSMGDYWDKVAADYMAANPNVTIEIEQIQNEDLQRTRIPTALQSGDAPDLFQQWGGGEMAAQAEAGYLMDLSDVLADDIERLGGGVAPWQVGEVTYGLPYQFAVEGIWYRKSLFEQAGITAEPTTMDELADAVDKLKAADITPIAVGAADGWPAAHWWYNFALRSCSQDVVAAAGTTLDFSDPCWLDAGTQLEEFIATKPFQDQFMSTVAQVGATSSAGMVANGTAAMELMGQWNYFVYQGFTDGSDEANQALLDDLDWFPMPATDGGAGDPSAAMGGGDGFSCYVDAPAECADFLAYIVSDDVQRGYAEAVGGLPVAPAAADAIASPVLQEIAQTTSSAAYVQLWMDTLLGPNVGGAMNDGIVNIFNGTGDAQGVVNAMIAAAATA